MVGIGDGRWFRAPSADVEVEADRGGEGEDGEGEEEEEEVLEEVFAERGGFHDWGIGVGEGKGMGRGRSRGQDKVGRTGVDDEDMTTRCGDGEFIMRRWFVRAVRDGERRRDNGSGHQYRV